METELRIFFFITSFLIIFALEQSIPKIKYPKKWPRFIHNFLLVAVDNLLLRILFPLLAVAWADKIWEHSLSPIAVADWLPWYLEIPIGIALMDLVIYFQHKLTHHLPILWRFHALHHADPHIDVSSALRFHPVEILFSMLYKFFFIFLFGISAESVLFFEILLNSSAMFNHGNFRIPEKWDRYLRYLIVTPDMHRIHHSTDLEESNSNFGFCLSLWDRLFSTYTAETKFKDKPQIGLARWKEKNLYVWDMLIQSFVKKQDEIQ